MSTSRPDELQWSEVFDPTRAEFARDRYAVYRRFREHDPVHGRRAARGGNRWAVFRHADVKSVLTDGAFGRQVVGGGPPAHVPGPFPAVVALISDWMLFRDSPDHERLRGSVARSFTPAEVARLRTRAEGLVERLLDRLEGREEFDLVEDFACPLSVRMIAELVGLDTDDVPTLRRWSNDLACAIDAEPSPLVMQRAERAASELVASLRAALAGRRREPRDDLISRLLAAQDSPLGLSDREVVSNCAFLLGAGQETTTSLIAFGAACLLQAPDWARRLCADEALLARAIEEFLRFESPIQITARVVRREVELGGRILAPGDRVDLVIGSANRDPEVFEQPERLTLERDASAHLAFAYGRHFCVGAELARMEAAVALGGLLRRMPHSRLAEPEIAWRPTIVFRSPERLRVRR